MQNDMCSIIMPAYNSASFISEAIDSVLKQTYKNWELIIVNDGSQDDTEKIIKYYLQKDKRIKLISLALNKGVANARNQGLKSANGRYVAFLDSDDYWAKDKLKKQIEILEKSNNTLIYTSYAIIDENNNIIKHREIKNRLFFNDILKENIVIFSSIIVKTSDIKELYFKQEWFHEDYIFLIDAFRGENIKIGVGINEYLVNYRMHKNSRSSNKLKSAKYRWIIYKNYLKYNFFKCLYYFINYAFKGLIKYI